MIARHTDVVKEGEDKSIRMPRGSKIYRAWWGHPTNSKKRMDVTGGARFKVDVQITVAPRTPVPAPQQNFPMPHQQVFYSQQPVPQFV